MESNSNLYCLCQNNQEVRGVRGIFFRVSFPDCFPVKIVHFGRPQTNFSGFKKWQAKKKKKKQVFCSISYLLPFHFPPLHFQLLLLFIHFPFFLAPISPGRSAKISQWKMSGGTLPPACYATARGKITHLPYVTDKMASSATGLHTVVKKRLNFLGIDLITFLPICLASYISPPFPLLLPLVSNVFIWAWNLIRIKDHWKFAHCERNYGGTGG